MDRSLTTSYDVKLLTENVRKLDRKSVQKIGISAAADEALQDGDARARAGHGLGGAHLVHEEERQDLARRGRFLLRSFFARTGRVTPEEVLFWANQYELYYFVETLRMRLCTGSPGVSPY